LIKKVFPVGNHATIIDLLRGEVSTRKFYT
jgi:hypothetical protein